MNRKITPEQAAILFRLLSGGDRGTTRGKAMSDDLGSDDAWALWNQLDDLMGERGIPRLDYVEVAQARA